MFGVTTSVVHPARAAASAASQPACPEPITITSYVLEAMIMSWIDSQEKKERGWHSPCGIGKTDIYAELPEQDYDKAKVNGVTSMSLHVEVEG